MLCWMLWRCPIPTEIVTIALMTLSGCYYYQNRVIINHLCSNVFTLLQTFCIEMWGILKMLGQMPDEEKIYEHDKKYNQ